MKVIKELRNDSTMKYFVLQNVRLLMSTNMLIFMMYLFVYFLPFLALIYTVMLVWSQKIELLPHQLFQWSFLYLFSSLGNFDSFLEFHIRICFPHIYERAITKKMLSQLYFIQMIKLSSDIFNQGQLCIFKLDCFDILQ
mgnify:CR=1 FL=1